MNDDFFYMKRCIELAKIAKARGDSAVGALIVVNERIIGEGIESGKSQKDITFHAEIEAIRHARLYLNSSDLSDCILYSTHEPCIMCSYVLRQHGVKKIVVGAGSGDIGGYSSSYPLLLDTSISKWRNPPEIITGVLENECKDLFE
ncbi:tRNA-specific adenosine deaminase [Sphingobacteriaceae bacterium]|nr:tRNA-specific adenosine deaminase [Sphingobacteriaceae bacterium]